MAKKQFAVIGLGRFGEKLCKALYNADAEVLAIDINQDRIDAIVDFTTEAICANASDERVLQKLGINNLDVVVVAIGSHIESSIFITLMCKQMGVEYVIAKAKNEEHKKVLKKIGADMVVFPEEAIAEKLANNLISPNMIEIMSLTDNFRIVEIRTPQKWQNKSLIELNLRNTEGVSIILIKRGKEVIVTPNGECRLLADDILVLAGSIADTNRLRSKATQSVLEEEI